MEKYSTKENETYREHAEKAVHKVEEHGQKARHNLQENMQKLKDDAEEAAIEAKNEARTGVHKMAGKIEEANCLDGGISLRNRKNPCYQKISC